MVYLKDVVKEGIRHRFDQLRAMGIQTVMITGDNPLTAAKIADESGVDDFLAEATPERKLELIRERQRDGQLVAMTGDGTNDAPALAQADVGVAMNTGTQAAREAGNMVDLDSNPTKLIEIVEIGKQLLITRGALTTFSVANDVAKYFAILPAIFAATYAAAGDPTGPLDKLNIMNLGSAQSAIISAIVFNALIIPLLVPLALRGVRYRPVGATALLRRNLLIYGVGGVIAPFIGHQARGPRWSTTSSAPEASRRTIPRMPDDGRGRYKIFLGMAAGVGKTYRMLQEGRAAQTAGRDVVIGILEKHGRAETAVQAEGLELLPRREVEYRGARIAEMDLPAVFHRAPQLCLIDELAHTNAPGLEHAKRQQDIDDVLDAGIDVFSTVNVQHLESLNDQVAELTGVRVKETFPDQVLSAADEVVLVDLTPEALVQRLREGRVYPPERVPTALNSFFRVENLSALREVALRQVAEDVEAKRLVTPVEALGTREEALFGEAPQPVAERVLALVRPGDSAQRLVRRAWRSSPAAGRRPRPPLRGPAGVAAAGGGPRGAGVAAAARGHPRGARFWWRRTTRWPRPRRAWRRSGARPTCSWASPRPRRGVRRVEESLAEGLSARLPGRGRADRGRPALRRGAQPDR